MTTNDLARLTMERAIRENLLVATPDQIMKATYKLLVWLENQLDGFTALAAEAQALVLIRLEMPKGWELVVMSDLVKVGVTEEECEDIIRERWYVVACDATGRQFAGSCLFSSLHEAQERLEQIARDGGVDPIRSNWYEMQPTYGSEAYISQGTEAELVAMERREAGL